MWDAGIGKNRGTLQRGGFCLVAPSSREPGESSAPSYHARGCTALHGIWGGEPPPPVAPPAPASAGLCCRPSPPTHGHEGPAGAWALCSPTGKPTQPSCALGFFLGGTKVDRGTPGCLLCLWGADPGPTAAVVPGGHCVALQSINCISNPVFLPQLPLALHVTVILYVGASVLKCTAQST